MVLLTLARTFGPTIERSGISPRPASRSPGLESRSWSRRKCWISRARLQRFCPGSSGPRGVDATQLTLARFLSHTHYLNDNAVVQSAAFTGAIPEPRWPGLIRFATRTGNEDLVYSNFGYNVAAMVIDRLRPEGWREAAGLAAQHLE